MAAVEEGEEEAAEDVRAVSENELLSSAAAAAMVVSDGLDLESRDATPSAVGEGAEASTSRSLKLRSRDTSPALPPPRATRTAAVAANKKDKDKESADAGGKKYNVLVVDDSAMSRKMLMKTMKAAGHTCEEAEDGQKAVDKVAADADKFHVILMDFVMPVMDGPDATKAIRDLGYTRPIIGVTGNTLDMDVKRFEESGSNCVIGKPFVSEKFYACMNEHETNASGHSPVGAAVDAAVGGEGGGSVASRPPVAASRRPSGSGQGMGAFNMRGLMADVSAALGGLRSQAPSRQNSFRRGFSRAPSRLTDSRKAALSSVAPPGQDAFPDYLDQPPSDDDSDAEPFRQARSAAEGGNPAAVPSKALQRPDGLGRNTFMPSFNVRGLMADVSAALGGLVNQAPSR